MHFPSSINTTNMVNSEHLEHFWLCVTWNRVFGILFKGVCIHNLGRNPKQNSSVKSKYNSYHIERELTYVAEKHQSINDGTQGDPMAMAYLLWNVGVFGDFRDFTFLTESRCSQIFQMLLKIKLNISGHKLLQLTFL